MPIQTKSRLIVVILDILHAVNSAGGTGNGLAGSILAIVLGLTGIVLGGLAFS